MEIVYLKSVDSTQKYLIEYLKNRATTQTICITSDMQTDGIGSRGNSWIGKEGNLFFSFSLPLTALPLDLKLQSASIYFAFLLKTIFSELGSTVFLKWPNDFYIENKKIGGVITNKIGQNLICGIGINIKNVSDEYGVLDIKIEKGRLLDSYFKLLEKNIEWKKVFSQFKIEFEFSKNFYFHKNGEKISLSKAILENDGSLSFDGEKVYSLR